MFEVSQITPMQWAFLMAAAFIQGMSKGGVPGLTVMAIDEAMQTGDMLDCGPMWGRYDAARGA